MTRSFHSSLLLIFAVLLSAGSPALTSAQEGVRIRLEHGPTLALSVREDLRVRENGVYQGLRYREQRALLSRREPGIYEGRLLTLQETLRSTVLTAKRVERTEVIRLTVGPDGGLSSPSGQEAPRLRLVPTFPDRDLRPGDEWSSPGLWVGDPARDARARDERARDARAGDSRPVTILLSVAYRYVGVDVHNGEPVHVFEAGYALRYPFAIPEKLEPLVESTGFPAVSSSVQEVRGSHRLTILVSNDGKELRLIRDVLTNQIALSDGTQRTEEGFNLTFFGTATGVDDSDLADVQAAAASVDAEVERVDEGVRITLSDVQFLPDSAEMLPGELDRVRSIAVVLEGWPDRSVLVVGHTADIGRPEGQQDLSVRRAEAVVNVLIAAGVHPGRLLYEGRGGREPVASNETEEGRSRNRRVEIILLNDKR